MSPPLFTPALGLLGLLAGALLGWTFFTSLRWGTQRLVRGIAVRQLVALQFARFAVLAAALWGLARVGAAPLLGALAGLILSRQWLLRGLARAARPT